MIFRTGEDIEFDFGIAKVNLTDLFGKSPQFGLHLPFSDFSFLLNAATGKSPIPSIIPPIRSPIELVVSKWLYNVVWKYITMGELLSEITKHDLTFFVAFIDGVLSVFMDRYGTQQLFSRLSPSVKVPGVVENTVPNGQFSLKAMYLKVYTENLIDLISFAMGTFQMNFLFDLGLPTLERLYELKRRVLSPIRNFFDFFKGLSVPLFDWVAEERNPYSDVELGISKHLFSSMFVIYHAVLTFVWGTTPKAVGS